MSYSKVMSVIVLSKIGRTTTKSAKVLKMFGGSLGDVVFRCMRHVALVLYRVFSSCVTRVHVRVRVPVRVCGRGKPCRFDLFGPF